MYQNPIIFKDYSDPDVIKHNGKYYMIASSFNYFPSLPLLESNDLINWNLVRYIIDYLPGYDTPRHGCGVWAPAFRYFNNQFYIFIPIPDEGIFVVTSKDLVNFSKPKNVYPIKGLIDPCPYFEDGIIYVACGFAKSRIGFNSKIGMFKLDLNLNLIEEYKIVFDGTNTAPVIEGPKIYKRNDFYYILAPAGSVETGWQVALRSKNIYGPYEMKIVMIQGDRPINGPHQGALVTDDCNNDWFIHFQDLRVYGRIINLEPVKWINDWPIIGDFDSLCGRPVVSYKKPTTKHKTEVLKEDYYFNSLSLEYQFPANIKEDFYSIENGFLRLNGIDDTNIYNIRNIISRKIDRKKFTVKVHCRAFLEDNSMTGLLMFGINSSGIYLSKNKDLYINIIESYEDNDIVKYCYKINSSDIYFKMDFYDKLVTFSYSFDDIKYYDIDYSFIATKGKWIGGKIALAVKGKGYALFEYLKILDLD